MKKIILAIVVCVCVIAGVFFIFNDKFNASKKDSIESMSQNNGTQDSKEIIESKTKDSNDLQNHKDSKEKIIESTMQDSKDNAKVTESKAATQVKNDDTKAGQEKNIKIDSNITKLILESKGIKIQDSNNLQNPQYSKQKVIESKMQDSKLDSKDNTKLTDSINLQNAKDSKQKLTESKTPKVVSTTKIKKGALEKQSTFVGSLNYKESAKIASQQAGLVSKVYFNIGDRVKKGQRLVSLNADILNKDLEVKLAKLQEAKYQAQKIQNELARYKNLLDSQSIALQQYENLEFDLKAKQSNILSLQADYDLSKEEIKKMTIYSPFNGVIIDKTISVGEWLKVGDSIALIVNTAQIEVIVYVPSNISSYLKLNQKVALTINGKNYTGQINALIPKAEVRSKTFPVYIKVANSPEFFDGMAVDVHLNTAGKASGYIVPRDSIVRVQGKDVVYVVRENVANAINANVLSLQDKEAVVLGAFKDDDLVVKNGQDRLSDGALVVESSKNETKAKKKK